MLVIRNHFARIAAIVSLALASGCAVHHPEPEVAIVDIALEVENRNWSDVVLYVVHDGTTTRFMSVTAAKTETVTIGRRFIGASGVVRFIAHRVGGDDDYYSPSVSVRTGSTIALTLQPELNMSSIGVW
ncbi:MAG: hypothetical protein M3Z30_11955 [Gemmatimonadota bacterium]|nr:hypothetical protein [Gemmatimonadota bacterium]